MNVDELTEVLRGNVSKSYKMLFCSQLVDLIMKKGENHESKNLREAWD